MANEIIKVALERMHECAEEAHFAFLTYGKGSPQHLLCHAIYADAAWLYESECKRAGREPYATYDED
jgi:hypothetical protein